MYTTALQRHDLAVGSRGRPRSHTTRLLSGRPKPSDLTRYAPHAHRPYSPHHHAPPGPLASALPDGSKNKLASSSSPVDIDILSNVVSKIVSDRFRRIGAGLLAVVTSISLFLGAPVSITASAAEQRILTFPVAEDPKLFEVQKTLVEAWGIVSEAFIDPTFNRRDWPSELSDRLNAIASATSLGDAESQIGSMVGTLGDPFTRWMSSEEYRSFRVSSDGELKGGVGLLIAQDPSSGRLMVLAPIKGSPAERAGIQPGDEVVTVNGQPTIGMDGEAAARVLRGEKGSSVVVEVARHKEAIPGVAGLVDPASTSHGDYHASTKTERKRFRLRRETVEFSPIFASTIGYNDHTYGYVRLATFSQHAAEDMRKAVEQLQRDGVEAFILDLRNNPGGLVTSAMDVASIWLDGSIEPTIFSIQDRSVEKLQSFETEDKEKLSQPRMASAPPLKTTEASMSKTSGTMAPALPPPAAQRVVLSGGHPLSQLPLVVLVNHQSASASELLAGALHDNARALVLGDRTFGKGKIQSVFELSDGSALFVTVAKYLTPSGVDIDQVGVQPDKSCSTYLSGSASTLTGIPVGPGADDVLIEELETDECVLSAETLLDTPGGNAKKVLHASI